MYIYVCLCVFRTTSMYQEVEHVLKVVQTAACLEVIHAMVGLVKSPWVTALMQGSRIISETLVC